MEPLHPLRPASLRPVPGEGQGRATPAAGPSFSNLLDDLVKVQKGLETTAAASSRSPGIQAEADTESLLQAIDEAGESFRSLTEIRDVLLQAYGSVAQPPAADENPDPD
jgi:flagellar hook-basal body complex protein FliE